MKSIVYNSDCLEAMRAMPDNFYSLAIVDRKPLHLQPFSAKLKAARKRSDTPSPSLTKSTLVEVNMAKQSLPNSINHRNIGDFQIGKAGEYLVCADLILKGYVAYLSEQGLPYDVVLDTGDRLLKVQVKTTRTHKQTPQRVNNCNTYAFNVKRRGKKNRALHTTTSCDLFALVALDERVVGYIPNADVRQTMFFRVEGLRGSYRDENIDTPVRGRYLTDLTLEDALQCL